MKKFLFFFFGVMLLWGRIGLAETEKKDFPPIPMPVVYDGVKYIAGNGTAAPNEKGEETWVGVIEAYDAKTEKQLWIHMIYAKVVDPKKDMTSQSVLITDLKLQGSVLIITNEKNEKYEMDPKTRTVKKLS